MNRRDLITMAAALAMPATDTGSAQKPGTRECYEFRQYSFTTAAQMERFSGYLSSAFVSAAHRAGAVAAGAFAIADKPDALTLYTLISAPDVSHCAQIESLMLQDREYLTAGAAVLALPAVDPPYSHMDASLMLAFKSRPHLNVPSQAAANGARVFELRTYESHSKAANLKKIEMFDAGEAAMFARAGMQPVFFGETIAGPQVPNLTYMLTYPDIASRGGFWKTWGEDPEKQRLFAIPEYSDKLIVSRIHSTFLRPLIGSMI